MTDTVDTRATSLGRRDVAGGVAEARVRVLLRDFDEAEADIRVLGVLKVRAQDFNCTELNLRLNGASEMDLSGHGNSLDATIQGASKLNAYDYEVTDAIVDANGASKARVYVTGTLEIEESVVSDVDYRGNPRVIRRD
ncbi:MAG: hypothetical protein HC859_07105 [Bacteroidia bacterium]|nr:hypothetical protein [Bacteroidia bacterium]